MLKNFLHRLLFNFLDRAAASSYHKTNSPENANIIPSIICKEIRSRSDVTMLQNPHRLRYSGRHLIDPFSFYSKRLLSRECRTIRRAHRPT